MHKVKLTDFYIDQFLSILFINTWWFLSNPMHICYHSGPNCLDWKITINWFYKTCTKTIPASDVPRLNYHWIILVRSSAASGTGTSLTSRLLLPSNKLDKLLLVNRSVKCKEIVPKQVLKVF